MEKCETYFYFLVEKRKSLNWSYESAWSGSSWPGYVISILFLCYAAYVVQHMSSVMRKRLFSISVESMFHCMPGPLARPHVYTPGIWSMWGYIVFAFPFVRSFVRTYVRSFVCLFVRLYVRLFVFLSQGQSFCVKVYKTSYFEDPLMDFIHIWHEGRYRSKVFISFIPTPGVTLGSRSRTSNFHKVGVKVFALKFIRPHILKTLWRIFFIFGMMVDIGLKFLSATLGSRLRT